MKYKNVLLATKTNQIGLYFELMDSKAQELNFMMEGGGGGGGDDDDDDEKTEEEDDEETEEEKEEEEKYSAPPPAKITKVEDEEPMDFGVAPLATSVEDEVPIDFKESSPPPPPPSSSSSSSSSQINKSESKSITRIATSVEDEMPLGFEADSIYHAETKTEIPFDTDLSGVDLNFFGSKSSTKPSTKPTQTTPPKPPATIKMTVTSVVATAGEYDSVSVKLSAQLTPDTAPPVWGDHSLFWRHESSSAHPTQFSLPSTLSGPEVSVSLGLLGLPTAKGGVDIYLDGEGSPEHVRVTIVPGALDRQASTFEVRPGVLRAGEPATVVVVARDAHSNDGVAVRAEDVAVVAQGKGQVTGVPSASRPSLPGALEYTLRFTASGKYKLFVSYARGMLSGSPAELAVAPGPLARVELKDIPAGHRAEPGGGTLPNFRIVGQDAFGNAVRCAPGDVRMELYAAGDRAAAGRVEGQKVEANAITGNLIVRGAAVAPRPGAYGAYVLRVAVGAAEAEVALDIPPPRLDVGKAAVVESPRCTQLGALCKFAVALRDALGAPYTGPVKEVALVCRMEGAACEALVRRRGDRAEMTFFPTRPGRAEVVVRVDGKDVPGSPFALDVVEPCELRPVVPVLNKDGGDDDKDNKDNNGKKGLAHTMMTTPSPSKKVAAAAVGGGGGGPSSYDTADCDLQTLPF